MTNSPVESVCVVRGALGSCITVWVLGGELSAVGGVGPTWIHAAVIMAALPPALNIFVLSTQYGVGVERASACVLLGTLGSAVTLAAFLWLIRTGRMPADLLPPS